MVALALIPEAVGFSVIAGVDPRVGLYASVAIAMTIALVTRIREADRAIYRVDGQIFFASVDRFVSRLGPEGIFEDAADDVLIDVSKAHFWDISVIRALDKLVDRMRRNGRHVKEKGINHASADLVDRFALEDRTGLELGVAPH